MFFAALLYLMLMVINARVGGTLASK